MRPIPNLFIFVAAIAAALMLASPAQATHHRSSHAKHHHRGGLNSTIYSNDGLSANGYTYRQNEAKFGLCVACNRFPLGTVFVLPSRHGRAVRCVNVDHIGAHSEFDLHTRTARVLGLTLSHGRWSLHPKVIGHINVMKHHHRPAKHHHR